MLNSVFQIVELVVLLVLFVWVLKLCSRLFRLHESLEQAPAMITALSEASDRLEASGTELKEQVAREVASVEQYLSGMRRIAGDLTKTVRDAEEIQIRLDQSVRAGQRVGAARAAAPSPHLAEPRGLDALPAARRIAGMEVAPLPAPSRTATLGFAPAAEGGRLAPVLRQEVSVGAVIPVPVQDVMAASPRMPVQETRRETVVVG